MTNGAEAASAGRLRAVASRALLLIASLLLTALLVELSLHVVSFIMQAGGRETQREWLTGDFRVLALGDSNTFGLFLEAHESYPGQLQASWNEDFATPKIEVVNLGYPSTNSSRLLLNFERLLEAFTPNVVLLQIGVNDYWTAPVPLDRESLADSALWETIRRHSRLYKLIYFMRRSAYDPESLEVGYNRKAFWDRSQDVNHTGSVRYGGESFELSEPFEPGSKKSSLPMPAGDRNQPLIENLETLVRIAREREVNLILVTYPSGASFYGPANRVIRRVAATTATALADPARVLAARCPVEECPDLFLPDHHATAQGNATVAEEVLEVLVRQIGPEQ